MTGLYLLLYSFSSYLFLFAPFSPVEAIRCQCSTQKGAVPCYNNWCEVFNGDGKEAACALVQSGNIRHYACVRVNKGSEDTCMVDKKNGQMQVRCWCRSSDYCNVDLSERVEEDEELPISAEEITTTTTTVLPPYVEKDDFVIDPVYESETLDVNYDDEDLSWEDDLPIDRISLTTTTSPRPPALPAAPTIPHWRREYPSGGQPAPPPRPPPIPDPRRQLQPPQPPPQRIPERPIEPPTTTTTQFTSTTTVMITPKPTSTVPSTTVTIPTTTTVRSTSTTARSTSTTATPSSKTTARDSAWLYWKKNREDAAKMYKQTKQRYRPIDLFGKKSSSTSTTEETTTAAQSSSPSTTTTVEPTTRTSTTTRRPTTVSTSTASTTTEEPTTTAREEPMAMMKEEPSTTTERITTVITKASSATTTQAEPSTTPSMVTKSRSSEIAEGKVHRPWQRSSSGGISIAVATILISLLV